MILEPHIEDKVVELIKQKKSPRDIAKNIREKFELRASFAQIVNGVMKVKMGMEQK
jgi:IS30 family transposase